LHRSVSASIAYLKNAEPTKGYNVSYHYGQLVVIYRVVGPAKQALNFLTELHSST
jgi:hypothetical protein